MEGLFFWEPYSKIQVQSLTILCKSIITELKISKYVIEHNTKINGIEKFGGILSKSNFDSYSTNLSPAFDFEFFRKQLENE